MRSQPYSALLLSDPSSKVLPPQTKADEMKAHIWSSPPVWESYLRRLRRQPIQLISPSPWSDPHRAKEIRTDEQDMTSTPRLFRPCRSLMLCVTSFWTNYLGQILCAETRFTIRYLLMENKQNHQSGCEDNNDKAKIKCRFPAWNPVHLNVGTEKC